MKKLLTFCVALILCVFTGFSFAGCGEDEININIYMPDGAPALAMAKLMYDDNDFGEDVDYNVVASSNISNYILQKKADVAILPINMASKILGDGENYKVVATVTNGNLYIVSNKDISTLADLNNEVIGVIGEGLVPDLTLKALLDDNDIDYIESETTVENKVAFRYFSDASTLIPMLKNSATSGLCFGLLPEPAVSKLLTMASDYNIELDIQALWDGGSYPQAVLVAKKSLCNNKTLINSILNAMRDNESWVLANSSKAVDAINDNLEEGLVASLSNTISSTAIENCNIKVVATSESGEIARMKSYLEKIRSVSSVAVGNYTDNLFLTYEN